MPNQLIKNSEQDLNLVIHVQQAKRISALLRILIITLLSIMVVQFVFTAEYDTVFAILMMFIVCTFLFYFLNNDTSLIVSGMLVWSLSVFILYLSWKGAGLFDTAFIAFPCVIALAIILTNRLLYLAILFFACIFILMIAYAHTLDLIEFSYVIDQNLVWRKALTSIIVLLYTFSIFTVFVKDYVSFIERLLKRNQILEQALKKAHHLSLYDLLTKLPNERKCQEMLKQHAEEISNNGNILAFITLDITNMRAINSSFGHSVGDAVLIELSQRLQALMPNKNGVYRFQGNEFIILKQFSDYEDISVFCEQILQACTTTLQISEYELELFAVCGIAVAPFDGDSLATLRKNSHLALSRAKSDNSLPYSFFEEELANIEINKYQMIKALKQALQNNEFELFYQPKINLHNKKVVGAEALIRWHRPGYGLISPDYFIPIAEESGLIIDITKWLANEAIQTCKAWHELGLTHLSVAINLSFIDFRRGNLPQIFFKMLTNANLPAHYFELELTESMLIEDVHHVQNQLHELHAKGIKLAIDDFGTGYSNLGYLSRFNVSTLKIDQSFIKSMRENEHDRIIVKAIIQMSHSLGIALIAEGIEDQETVNLLIECDCHYGQGYWWAKPMPNTDFIAYCQKIIH